MSSCDADMVFGPAGGPAGGCIIQTYHGVVFQRAGRLNSSPPRRYSDSCMSELDAPPSSLPAPSSVIDTAGGQIPRGGIRAYSRTAGSPRDSSVQFTSSAPGFPLVAGLALYGWRALLCVLIVLATAAGALSMWRRIGRRGEQLRYPHGLWMALLLALTLPAHC